MKNRLLSKVWIALFSVCIMSILFVGCKENSSIDELSGPQIKQLVVKNGRLKFVDENHFNDVLKHLESNQSEDFLNSWEKQFVNYQSSRTMFNNITEKDIEKIAKSNSLSGYEDYLTLITDYDGEDKIATKQIPSVALGTLFNYEGLVLIGKDVFKYTLDKLVKISDFNEEDLEKYRNNILSNKVNIFPITQVTKSVKNARVAEISNSEHCTAYVASNQRFAADYNLYKCAGTSCITGENKFRKVVVSSIYQKRLLGIWYSANPYKIKRDGKLNNYFGYLTPTFTNSSIPDATDTYPDLPIIVNSIWVSVTGQRGSGDAEVTCTCGIK
jgi:hypothetical protein